MTVDECESTNDLARDLAEKGAPHGTWISARRQSAGRGRLGRKWESLEGNLFLSIIARMGRTSALSWVPMASAVAIAECLREFNPKFEIEVKWPNDLWLGRAKLGGILCEAVGNASGSYIVIGIGLNCVHAPEGLDQKTIALGVHCDEIRQPLISAVLSILEELKISGSESIFHRYEKLAALKHGTPIEWKAGEQISHGIVQGVGSSGELVVESAGSVLKLYAEDVKVRISDLST